MDKNLWKKQWRFMDMNVPAIGFRASEAAKEN